MYTFREDVVRSFHKKKQKRCWELCDIAFSHVQIIRLLPLVTFKSSFIRWTDFDDSFLLKLEHPVGSHFNLVQLLKSLFC